jgi:GAF domain-containing protein
MCSGEVNGSIGNESPRDHALQQLLKELLNHCLQVSQTQHGAVGIFDESGNLYYVANSGSLDLFILKHDQGITRGVRESGQTVVIRDVRQPAHTYPSNVQHCQYLSNRIDTVSEMIVPIVLRNGTLFGVINLQSPYVHWFKHDVVHAIEILAAQVSIKIQRYRIDCRVQTLRDFGKELTAAEDYRALAHNLFQHSHRIFSTYASKENGQGIPHIGAMRLLLWSNDFVNDEYRDHVGQIYWLRSQYDEDGRVFSKFLHNDDQNVDRFDTLEKYILSRQLILEDLETHYYMSTRKSLLPVPLDWKLARDFESHIMVPIEVKGERIGILSLHARRENAFNRDDLLIVQHIVSSLSIGVGNIDRSLRSRASLSALHRIDDMIKQVIIKPELDSDDNPFGEAITAYILDQAKALTQASDASLFTASDGDHMLKRINVSPNKAKDKLELGETIHYSDNSSISVLVARHQASNPGKSILVKHCKDEHPEVDQRLGGQFQSLLAVPMLDNTSTADGSSERKLIGVISVRHGNVKRFDENDRILLQALANQAAVAYKTRQSVRQLARITSNEAWMDDSLEKVSQDILTLAVDLMGGAQRKIGGVIRQVNIVNGKLELLGDAILEGIPAKKNIAWQKRNPEWTQRIRNPHGVEIYDWGRQQADRKPAYLGMSGRVVKTGLRFRIRDADERENEYPDDYIELPPSGVISQMSVAIRGLPAAQQNDEVDHMQYLLNPKEAACRNNSQAPAHETPVTKTEEISCQTVRGVLTIFSEDKNAFTDLDFDVLTALAKMAGLAWSQILQRERLRKITQVAEDWLIGSRDRWDMIWDIIGELFYPGKNPTPQVVGTMYIFHQGRGELHRVAVRYPTQEYEESYATIQIGDEGVQAWVAERNNMLATAESGPCIANIPDMTYEDLRLYDPISKAYYKVRPVRREHGLYHRNYPASNESSSQGSNGLSFSELCVPILGRARENKRMPLLGILNIESPIPHAFDRHDAELLFALAKQIAYTWELQEIHRRNSLRNLAPVVMTLTHIHNLKVDKRIESMVNILEQKRELLKGQLNAEEINQLYEHVEDVRRFIGNGTRIDSTGSINQVYLSAIRDEIEAFAIERGLTHKPKFMSVKTYGDSTIRRWREVSVRADPSWRHVVRNLLTNATRHSQEDSDGDLSEAEDNVHVEILVIATVYPLSSMVELCIENKGKLIPEHIIDQIDQFAVSHGAGAGYGWGLGIVRVLMENVGGMFEIANKEDGNGVVARLWFIDGQSVSETKSGG